MLCQDVQIIIDLNLLPTSLNLGDGKLNSYINKYLIMKLVVKNSKVLVLSMVLLISLSAEAQRKMIDLKKSSVKWTGYHLGKSYEHYGNVSIKSGHLDLKHGNLSGGEIVIDMTTITDTDIDDEVKNAKLVNHLKAADWFDVGSHPEAKLTMMDVSMEGDALEVRADIWIRGIKQRIDFEASKDPEGIYNAELKVDRLKHKVLYGWSLENAMIDGEFKLEVKIALE